MRWSVALAAGVLLGGCSIIFDPDDIPTGPASGADGGGPDTDGGGGTDGDRPMSDGGGDDGGGTVMCTDAPPPMTPFWLEPSCTASPFVRAGIVGPPEGIDRQLAIAIAPPGGAGPPIARVLLSERGPPMPMMPPPPRTAHVHEILLDPTAPMGGRPTRFDPPSDPVGLAIRTVDDARFGFAIVGADTAHFGFNTPPGVASGRGAFGRPVIVGGSRYPGWMEEARVIYRRGNNLTSQNLAGGSGTMMLTHGSIGAGSMTGGDGSGGALGVFETDTPDTVLLWGGRTPEAVIWSTPGRTSPPALAYVGSDGYFLSYAASGGFEGRTLHCPVVAGRHECCLVGPAVSLPRGMNPLQTVASAGAPGGVVVVGVSDTGNGQLHVFDGTMTPRTPMPFSLGMPRALAVDVWVDAPRKAVVAVAWLEEGPAPPPPMPQPTTVRVGFITLDCP